MRIAGRAVVDVFAGEIIGVFAHVESAHEHRAGRFEPLISGESCPAGLRSRLIFDPATVGRPATSNRFLTANGTPASGPSRSPFLRAASIAAARCQRALLGDGGEGVERAVLCGDARERARDHVARAHLAVMDGIGDRVGGRPGEIHGQATNTGAGSASSGSLNSATWAPWRKVTCRLVFTAAFHAGSIGRSSARAAASIRFVKRIGHGRAACPVQRSGAGWRPTAREYSPLPAQTAPSRSDPARRSGPARMTSTRSHRSRTTLRSCDTNR